MKTLVFTSLFPNNIWPHHGVFVKERMRHFANLKGCEIKVIAPVPYFPPVKINRRWNYSQVLDHEYREGLEVYHPRYLMIPKVGMLLQGLMMCGSVLPAVLRIKKDFDFDIIDSHYVYPDGFAAILLGHILNKPVVISARGSDINLFTSFPVIRRLIRYSLMKADKVIAVCQALKEAMTALGVADKKVRVIPNGVDLGKFYPIPKDDARRKLGLKNKRIILSVGGLVERKGFDILIRATKILIQEFKKDDLLLIIAGDGPLRTDLKKLVWEHKLGEFVHFCGDIPHEELYVWYSAANVFCLASSREGWPNVILESMACGTPVVATDVWGVPEIVSSPNVGLLTKRSEREIAMALKQALETEWHPQTLSEFARTHTWDQAARSVLNVFHSALKKGERSSSALGVVN